MSDETRERDRRLVEIWGRAGEALDAMKREELRNYDFEANREIIDGLMQLGALHAQPRETCGLQEQQMYFMRWWDTHEPKKK